MVARARFTVILLSGALACGATLAWAQVYPTKSIRMLVGASPGGGADIIARIIGQKLGESFQHQIVVDNRAGAGGNIAAELTAKAAPDGYTLLMMATSYAANVGFPQKLSYDLVNDFAPVTLIGSSPNVLVASPSLPARTLTELIELARAKPGQLNFASSGTISLLYCTASVRLVLLDA